MTTQPFNARLFREFAKSDGLLSMMLTPDRDDKFVEALFNSEVRENSRAARKWDAFVKEHAVKSIPALESVARRFVEGCERGEAVGEVFFSQLLDDARKVLSETGSTNVETAELKALRALARDVAKLSPATKDFNPGIGAGMLNSLIADAERALALGGAK